MYMYIYMCVYIYMYIYIYIHIQIHIIKSWPDEHYTFLVYTAIFHTKNCQTKNL